jgi:hypothetical protein
MQPKEIDFNGQIITFIVIYVKKYLYRLKSSSYTKYVFNQSYRTVPILN